MKTEKTLIMLKPEAFRRGLVASIIELFVMAGLRIIAIREISKPSRTMLEAHYTWPEFVRLGKQYIRRRVIKYCCSGRLLFILLEGEDAVAKARAVVGDRNPLFSKAGTIRSMVDDSFEAADSRGEAMRDLIHAPRDLIEAEQQIALWFGGG